MLWMGMMETNGWPALAVNGAAAAVGMRKLTASAEVVKWYDQARF